MSKSGPQKFGSIHTQIKLGRLANYLPAYTTALQNKGFTLHYVDAFAGTGKCTIQAGIRDQTIPGSAWIALHCKPPFQKFFFIEKSRKKYLELRRFAANFPDAAIDIRHGDANIELPSYLSSLSRSDRVIVNLDPFGMHVDWSTLAKIAATKAADVWYLFSLSGFYRQAAKDSANVDAKKAAALTRILGPHDWRSALYAPPPQASLFGDDTDRREADPIRMSEWVTGCLKTIFPGVVGPQILYMTTKSGRQGPPIFALYFLISNPDPKALGLAKRIGLAVLKR